MMQLMSLVAKIPPISCIIPLILQTLGWIQFTGCAVKRFSFYIYSNFASFAAAICTIIA